MLTAWARLKWFAANAPEIYDRTRTMCRIADWIVLELTGELLMEETLAVESGLGLIASGEPARALALAFNLGDIQLPATCPPGTVVGTLKKKFPDPLGLHKDTPVVACGPDAQSGLVGLGAQLPNVVGINSGWTTFCQRITERPVFDDTRAMWTGRHVIENRWVLEGSSGDTGGRYVSVAAFAVLRLTRQYQSNEITRRTARQHRARVERNHGFSWSIVRSPRQHQCTQWWPDVSGAGIV
jgi:sugar (pentulose or hexulose) kinase